MDVDMKERTRKIAFIFLIAAIVSLVAVIIVSLFTAPNENPSENGDVTDEETTLAFQGVWGKSPGPVTAFPIISRQGSLYAYALLPEAEAARQI